MKKILKKAKHCIVDGTLFKKIRRKIKFKKIKKIKSDEEYLIEYSKLYCEKTLNLSNPKTFDEKLNWLKINKKVLEYKNYVDKYEAKIIAAHIIGEKYIIPTYGIYNNIKEIDFDNLPNQFVIKTTHDSGGVFVCKEKTKKNIKRMKSIIEKSMKRNFYSLYREYPYKDVKPRIIIEKLITNSKDSNELNDYKFFCFNGEVDSVMVCCDRSSGNTKFYFMDLNWNLKKYNKSSLLLPENFSISRPSKFNEMIEIARKLSVGKRFVRIDLYESNNNIYFGEFTFFPDAGFDSNLLDEAQDYYGKLINID